MKPRLKFMLEYLANPLWADDELAREELGYEVENLKDLGLSDKTIELSKFVTELYWDRLNPIYPMLPSFWSGEMCLFFQAKVRQLYDNVLSELRDKYDIVNKEKEELNQIINIQKINSELDQFLSDPASYYRAKGISFYKTDAEEKLEVNLEFKKWKQKELSLLVQ